MAETPAKKAPAKRAPAKPKASPVKVVAAGGGPEDPVADVAAVKAARERRQQRSDERAENRESRAQQSHANRQADRSAKLAKPGKVSRSVSWAWSGSRRLLTAEFVLCIAVLLLGYVLKQVGAKQNTTSSSTSSTGQGAIHVMIKGSALAGLFFLLALLMAGGKNAAKTATALGTLVTATYVLTSSDVHDLVSWANSFFASTPSGSSGAEESAPEGAG